MVTVTFKKFLGSSAPELSYELSEAVFSRVLPELYAGLDSSDTIHVRTDDGSYNLKVR